MNENINENVENQEVDYIQAINELKANTVDRDKYDKLKEENKKLLNSLVSGNALETPKQEPGLTIDEMRQKLFGGTELTNIDYVKTVLDLRDALIAKGERDPFLPIGNNVAITNELCQNMEDVARGLREMVDFADGDSGVFTAEYQRRVQDPIIPGRRR